jgi:PKD-like domain
MLRNRARLLGFLAPIALVALSTPQVFAQKTKVVSSVNAPLTLSLAADSNIVTACAEGGSPHVKLTANAVSPNGNPIKYRWTTSAGTIIGEGPIVEWNLAGLKPGYHKASLDIQSIGSDGSCQAFSSVSVLVNPCVAVQPVCPAIEIVCPNSVELGQPITFSSRLTGGIPANATAYYNWTVSAGTIIQGQGTDTIKVDTTGAGGQSVKASLSVGGYNLECAADCSVAVPLPRVTISKFDEFPDISRNDEKARLDNYAIALQNDPTATAHVIVYPGRNGKKGEVQLHANRIVDYLVNSRGLDKSRIVTLVGPARDSLLVQLWITPQGATPPNP